MLAGYGVVESGTTQERLVLWGPGYPVIEIDVSDMRHPCFSIVGLGETPGLLHVDFRQATISPAQPVHSLGDLHFTDQAAGWQVSEAHGHLVIIDPLCRHALELMPADNVLLAYSGRPNVDAHPRLIALHREDLYAKSAWPVIPSRYAHPSYAHGPIPPRQPLPGRLCA